MPVTARFQRRKWATVDAPAHKSDLNALSSQHACPKKWRYEQDEMAAGRHQDDDNRVVYGRTALGSATHEALAWFLSERLWRDRILAGTAPTPDQVKRVYFEMFDRAVGARQLEWSPRDRAQGLHEERVQMITGALSRLHERVASVELIEAAFIVQQGDYWLSGHVDLVYGLKQGGLGLADWKTGANKPHQLELDHGWEAGVYSAALRDGIFLRRESVQLSAAGTQWAATCCGVEVMHPSRYRAERTVLEQALIGIAKGTVPSHVSDAHVVRYGVFPSCIDHVHLGDYVPYKRAGKKTAKRPEDIRYYGVSGEAEVEYKAGEHKGPAWLPVRRTEHDVPRLRYRMRTPVAMVRLNVFPDNIGERCSRCGFQRHCLTSGYTLSAEEQAQLDAQLSAAGSVHQELSLDD